MSFLRTRVRLVLVAASCLAIGAGASAIASAGAATTTPNNHGHLHRRGPRSLVARAVHADLVVHAKNGFVTVTVDRGVVQSVSGQQLTIAEGTKKATYKTVTITIPANARVRDNRQKAALAAVKPGQRATVVQGLKRTIVVARTPRTA
ncbi:MAG: hypothetical protein M3Y17_11655 [Actinomycetota bacterium]|nr:hypothetical protein [Actinomycetota bacterium]